MKWWAIALIGTVVWVGVCLAYGCLFFPSQTTPAEDARLSGILGEAAGAGSVGVWALAFMIFGNKEKDQ
jgi:membrane protein DedA with SNARE-associated domain